MLDSKLVFAITSGVATLIIMALFYYFNNKAIDSSSTLTPAQKTEMKGNVWMGLTSIFTTGALITSLGVALIMKPDLFLFVTGKEAGFSGDMDSYISDVLNFDY